MPGCLLLLLVGNCLFDFQVDEVGKQHLDQGLQKILQSLQTDLAEGLPAKQTDWASKKLSVDPKETFFSQPPSDRASREPQIGLWKQVSQNENYLASTVPAQLPHRVNRGTGCQNIESSVCFWYNFITLGCPGGEGNYGFNSFNFMTFTLLVFNLVANVNNNLNNNNNNANKNNINAISQDSNNVASNTNAVNQIGVTVLPIPGKR